MVELDFAHNANHQEYDAYFGRFPIRPTHALQPGEFGFGSYFVYPRSPSPFVPPPEQSAQTLEEEIGPPLPSPQLFLRPAPYASPVFEEPIIRYEYEQPPRLRPKSRSRTHRRRPFVVRHADDAKCGHCNTRAFGECSPVRACDRMWWRAARQRCTCGC